MNSTTDNEWATGSDIPAEPTEKLVGMGPGGVRYESESKPAGYYSNQLRKLPSDITKPHNPRYITTQEPVKWMQIIEPKPPDAPGIWHLASTAVIAEGGSRTMFYTWENAEEFYD